MKSMPAGWDGSDRIGAYYGFVSVFPLLLVLVTVFGAGPRERFAHRGDGHVDVLVGVDADDDLPRRHLRV